MSPTMRRWIAAGGFIGFLLAIRWLCEQACSAENEWREMSS